MTQNIIALESTGKTGTGLTMDLSPFKKNFEKNRNRQKYQHSLKEHPKFTKIAKFGCEMS